MPFGDEPFSDESLGSGGVPDAEVTGDPSATAGMWSVGTGMRAIGWGIWIGTSSGALSGVVLGALDGWRHLSDWVMAATVVGIAVALLPAVVGGAAIAIATRPSTDPASFRRRVRVVLAAEALVVLVVGIELVTFFAEMADARIVAVALSVVPAWGWLLLLRADRSLGRRAPSTASRRL